MTPAHLHLILNHFTVVGSVFGFALLAWAMLRRSREAVMLSLTFNVVIALISIPVYFTGEPASDQVARLDNVAPDAIEEHEEAANFAFAAVECVGALALAGVLLFRTEPVPRWFLMITLIGALLSVGAAIYTADRGRRIRHTELGWVGPAISVFSCLYCVTRSPVRFDPSCTNPFQTGRGGPSDPPPNRFSGSSRPCTRGSPTMWRTSNRNS